MLVNEQESSRSASTDGSLCVNVLAPSQAKRCPSTVGEPLAWRGDVCAWLCILRVVGLKTVRYVALRSWRHRTIQVIKQTNSLTFLAVSLSRSVPLYLALFLSLCRTVSPSVVRSLSPPLFGADVCFNLFCCAVQVLLLADGPFVDGIVSLQPP